MLEYVTAALGTKLPALERFALMLLCEGMNCDGSAFVDAEALAKKSGMTIDEAAGAILSLVSKGFLVGTRGTSLQRRVAGNYMIDRNTLAREAGYVV